jgi:phospholipid/cholesterol/gamma-HCH transport system substrate-binding protein
MFLVGFVVLLFGGLIFVAGSQFWEERDPYVIHFSESVAGLDVGSPIKLNGVAVGRVESVGLDPSNIENVIVEITINGGIPLRRDAEAVVQLAGITGLKYIELNPGTRGQPRLPPGSRIRAGTSNIDMLTGRAEDIARQIQLLLTRLLRVTSDENLEHIDGIIEELHRTMTRVAVLARNLGDVVDENRPEIKRTLTNFGDAADTVNKASGEVASTIRVARDDLHGTLVAGERAAKRIETLAGSADKAVTSAGGLIDDAREALTRERFQQVMDALIAALQSMTRVATSLQRTVDQGQTDITGTLEAIRDASEQLEDFARTIRDNPGALLRSGNLPEEEVPR